MTSHTTIFHENAIKLEVNIFIIKINGPSLKANALSSIHSGSTEASYIAIKTISEVLR